MSKVKTLNKAKVGKIYIIEKINGKEETQNFLGNIGCREGEQIMIVSKVANNLIVNILAGRYGLDEKMAKLIEVK